MHPIHNQARFSTAKFSAYNNMWGSGFTLTPTCSGDRPGT